MRVVFPGCRRYLLDKFLLIVPWKEKHGNKWDAQGYRCRAVVTPGARQLGRGDIYWTWLNSREQKAPQKSSEPHEATAGSSAFGVIPNATSTGISNPPRDGDSPLPRAAVLCQIPPATGAGTSQNRSRISGGSRGCRWRTPIAEGPLCYRGASTGWGHTTGCVTPLAPVPTPRPHPRAPARAGTLRDSIPGSRGSGRSGFLPGCAAAASERGEKRHLVRERQVSTPGSPAPLPGGSSPTPPGHPGRAPRAIPILGNGGDFPISWRNPDGTTDGIPAFSYLQMCHGPGKTQPLHTLSKFLGPNHTPRAHPEPSPALFLNILF